MKETENTTEINESKPYVDYNEFMDSLGKKTDEFNIDEKMRKVEKIKLDGDKKFIRKYGFLKLFFVKQRLSRYIRKQNKYNRLLSKYTKLHGNLSLAISSGFSNTKEHQTYLKDLAKRTAEKSDKFRNEVS